jgi:hypothetical protein
MHKVLPSRGAAGPRICPVFQAEVLSVPIQALVPKMLDEGLDPDVLKDEE